MRAIFALCVLCAVPVAAQDFFTLKGHGGPIMDIAVSPSGQIATASFDNSVGLWESDGPVWLEGSRAAVNTVAFARDDIILAGGDDFNIWWWRAGAPKPKLVGSHTAKIKAIEVGNSLPVFASASWDHTIGLWTPGNPINEEADWATASLKGHRKGVNDIVFSANDATLYSASVDGTIRVWDVHTAAEKHILVKHGFGVNTLTLNEKDGWLAYGATDGGTRIIHPETGAEIADFTLDRRPILSMAYHADTQQLAVGDGQGFIMVIDTGTMQIARDFRATKRGPIWALAFSANGQNIHAGGIEDIMYSWPIATMDEHGQMSTETRSFLEAPETLPNGERQFKRKCSICHTLTEGSARKAGPSLYNLFGRKAGTVADYSYSDTLSGSDIIWSAETINALFDIGPDHYIAGTKMPMQRIVKQQDRDDLVEYLRQATGEREK